MFNEFFYDIFPRPKQIDISLNQIMSYNRDINDCVLSYVPTDTDDMNNCNTAADTTHQSINCSLRAMELSSYTCILKL